MEEQEAAAKALVAAVKALQVRRQAAEAAGGGRHAPAPAAGARDGEEGAGQQGLGALPVTLLRIVWLGTLGRVVVAAALREHLGGLRRWRAGGGPAEGGTRRLRRRAARERAWFEGGGGAVAVAASARGGAGAWGLRVAAAAAGGGREQAVVRACGCDGCGALAAREIARGLEAAAAGADSAMRTLLVGGMGGRVSCAGARSTRVMAAPPQQQVRAPQRKFSCARNSDSSR
jgi:hypothetical protein